MQPPALEPNKFVVVHDRTYLHHAEKQYNNLMNIALKAHKLIGCSGVTRSDFKFKNGKFYLLEINTQPGMTNLSLVPEIAAYKGISFIKLLELILKDRY